MHHSSGSGHEALVVRPLTRERWEDFERLFGKHGAYGGCWCMYWRITRKAFGEAQGEGNRQAMRALVDQGEVTGLLGYIGDEPVAWCSIAPRERFGSLNRSPVLKPLDDKPVWSIVCFFVDRGFRNQGVAGRMLSGSLAYAREQGAGLVEAYPSRPRGGKLPPVSSYMGVPSLFESAGFEVVAQPSEIRLIMRKALKPRSDG